MFTTNRRATLRLPANVPLGRHTARAYLFRQGLLVAGFGRAMDIGPRDIAKLATLGVA